MSARRFFIDGIYERGASVRVPAADAHKIRNVLRLRSGDAIETIDSSGTVFSATILADGAHVDVQLIEVLETPAEATALRIDVAQGLPKGQKMDFIIEKLTELGVARILPFTSERTIVRDAHEAKLERWKRLAQSAAQQSGRRSIPQIAQPLSFDGVLEAAKAYDLVLFPWEIAASDTPLKERLPGLLSGAKHVLAIIGPEGGFSHGEAERAQQAGAQVISLGGRILRTETAGLVLVSILQYLSA